MLRDVVEYTILDAKAATGIGKAIKCQDYKYAVLSFATSDSANLTVKFQGAISDGSTEGSAPNFAGAQSVANMWDYVEVIDLEDGSAIDGDTGIALSGTDDYRLLQMNIDGLKYLNARVTAYIAGKVTVKVVLFN